MGKPSERLQDLRAFEPRPLLRCLRLPVFPSYEAGQKWPGPSTRLGHCAIGFGLLLGSCGMEDLNLRDDVCDYSIDEFFELRSELESRTDLSKDVMDSILIKIGYRKLETPTDIIEYLDESKNMKFHGYERSCIYKKNVHVTYQTYFVEKSRGIIDLINFRAIMDVNSFLNSGQEFRYEFFTNRDDSKKAIWAITGPGTRREDLERLLKLDDPSEGIYVSGDRIVDGKRHIQYRRPSKIISIYVLIINAIFDSEDRLISIN